jgi:hypothetical protein
MKRGGRASPALQVAIGEDQDERKGFTPRTRRAQSEVAGVPCPDRKSKELRAEEDGFALEHFDGDKKRGRGVDARGGEDDGD